MSTELDIAKMMWGWGESGSSGDNPGSGYGDKTTVRYGTVTAVNEDGTVTIKLDGTGELITLKTSTPLAVGDRVTIVVQGGQYMVYALDETIRQMEQQKSDLAQQIIDEGNAIKDEVDAEMEAWKQDHQLTDDDIEHSITTAVSGATETWEGQLSSVENDIETNYALKTEVTQGINGLKSEIEENYTTSEGVTNEINTAITQASGEIQSTVEQNVMNEVGDTFATKTELTQTEQDLTLTINQSVANGYATCSTSAGTRAKTATCTNSNFALKQGFNLAVKFSYANTATSPTLNVNGTGAKNIRLGNSNITPDLSWDAGDTVLMVYDGTYWQVADAAMKTAKTVESYFVADSTGLTVGQNGESSAVKMNSNGSFQVLENGSSILDISNDPNYGAMIQTPMWNKLGIRNNSSSMFLISQRGYSFSSMYSAFSVNNLAAVECAYLDCGGTTQAFSGSFPYGLGSDLRRAVIYYHSTYNYNAVNSVKFEIRQGENKHIDLQSVTLGASQILICVEHITINFDYDMNVEIWRGNTYRASISTGVGINTNPGKLFAIDGIAICLATDAGND